MDNGIEKTKRNSLDGTTWEFLNTGWWAWHVIAIAFTFYLGHLLWPMR
ncbi:MAG: hypothetical protein PHC60_02005 [Heliobacteriaceae bacterium]|nr:hypothetical protein [Heliobacteriaceae bacterium]MDD4587152.1 hypothetical protein [Heliobacteriaceae bacterium]